MFPRSALALLLCVPLPLLTTGAHAQANLALGKPVSASGPVWGGQLAAHLTDGILTNQSHPLASSNTLGFTYEIDLERSVNLDRIELVNRTGCCPERLSNYRVALFADGGGSPGAELWRADIRTNGSHSGDGGRDILRATLDRTGTFAGRFLHVINLSNAAYNPQIAEIEVFESPIPAIRFFTTDQGNITRTGNPGLPTSATLSWNVTGADTVSISSLGAVAATGRRSVSPDRTTTYLLTATNPAGDATATVAIGVDEPSVPPILTEFMADNGGLIEDQDGDNSDWVELHNPNRFALNLDGYFLSDDPALPTKWRIPSVSIPAHGYLVVFASGKDLLDPAQPLHANFNLARTGEYLSLTAPDGVTVLGQFPPDHPATATYPPQRQNRSYGLSSTAAAAFFDPATPGAPNGPGFSGFVEDTEFDIDRGYFFAPFAVTITTATPSATIRYTTNGSAPSPTRGTIYNGPVAITTTTVLRAMAYKDGCTPTDVDTQTYLFPIDVSSSPELDPAITGHAGWGRQVRTALQSLPSASLVTAAPVNDSSEVTASFEMLYPDATPGFQEDCGVRNFGGAFTNFPKKNFRLYFRSQYGASRLQAPVFAGEERGGFLPVESFDQLELRGGSHDMKQRGFYLSNLFTDDTMLDMGNLNPHGRFIHLYLNGRYWGMYHLRERWNADMLSKYLGGAKEDYEAINGNWNVGGWAEPVVTAYDGDGSAWERIKSLRGNYKAVRPYHDVPHYIDYMLMFMFGNSEDEYRCAGPNDVGSGFKWFLNDADGFTRDVGDRTARSTPGRMDGDGPGSLFSMLFAEADPDYRTLLADRIHRHFFNDGAMTSLRMRSRLQERVTECQRAMIPEVARWRGTGGDLDSYLWPDEWINKKNSYIASVLPTQTSDVLATFRNAGFYPALNAPVLSQHGGNVPAGFALTLTAPAGTIYFTLDGTDPRLPGGRISPGARPYAGPNTPITLAANTIVKARTSQRGQWSALAEAFFTADGAPPVSPGELAVSELHYNPPGSDDLEFVELRNISPHAINLRGVRFTDGIQYTFASSFDTLLAAGQRLLLVSSLHAFQQARGLALPVAGVYFGNFDNDGESVSITTADGTALLSFSYHDDPAWPADADGQGASLVYTPPAPGGDPTNPLNWRPSLADGGTPLGSDRVPFSGDPLHDADGNGLGDLLDYALGNLPGERSDPRLTIDDDGRLRLEVPRALGSDDAALHLEGSTDLLAWPPADDAFTLTSRVRTAPNREILTFTSVAPLDSLPPGWFLRVAAQPTP